MADQTEVPIEASFPMSADAPQEPKVANPERIDKLRKSKIKLSQIQQELEKLIDALAQNPSILSRLSMFWGKIPLWQKIIAGIVLIVPPLTLGIIAHILTCFVISVFALITYVGGSVILDDHYSHTQYSTKNIKTGVTSLAEGLDVIIHALEQISQALSEQVDLFTQENKQFGENVATLKTRNEQLTIEIDQLQQTKNQLLLTQKELEKTCDELKTATKEQSKVLEETQTALNKVKIDYAQNQKQFDEHVKELKENNLSLNKEITKYKRTQQALAVSFEVMQQMAIADEQQRQAYTTKLNKLIEKSDTSIFEMSHTYQQELDKVKAVCSQYEEELTKLKRLTEQTEANVHILENVPLLKNHGFYAHAPVPEESIDLEMLNSYPI